MRNKEDEFKTNLFINIKKKDLKGLKNVSIKIKSPKKWYQFWKNKLINIPICPITNIEMKIEVIKISLELFPNHIDRNKMIKGLEDLIIEYKQANCNCEKQHNK